VAAGPEFSNEEKTVMDSKRTNTLAMAALAACVSASSGIASADPGDLYLGLGVMNVSGASQKDDINRKLKDQGYNASVSEYDDSRYGWNINGYLQLAPQWGVELGYADLGKVKVKIDGVAADVDSFLSAVTDLHPITASGVTLALAGRHGFAPKWAVQAKGGFFFWRSSYELNGVNTSKRVKANGTGLVFGLQAIYAITPQVDANAGLQLYTVESQLNTAVGLGVTYRMPVLKAGWLKWPLR
jgi:hypothetical protein